MDDDQFTKLYQYMTERFDSIESKLDKKAESEDIQKVLSLLDSLSKRQEISDDERIVMTHQLAKIHEWVEKAASRIDLKFDH